MESLIAWRTAKNTSDFSVSTVPADGPALFGARPSVTTVLTKFDSHINTGPALWGLTHVRFYHFEFPQIFLGIYVQYISTLFSF